mmetsp:Transcript_4452/g.10899  ORF Transcript_4452/g.10899 Transcript_4452/m.10899 type:complete len:205 (-) Transcript_4452:1360-1974(-)
MGQKLAHLQPTKPKHEVKRYKVQSLTANASPSMRNDVPHADFVLKCTFLPSLSFSDNECGPSKIFSSSTSHDRHHALISGGGVSRSDPLIDFSEPLLRKNVQPWSLRTRFMSPRQASVAPSFRSLTLDLFHISRTGASTFFCIIACCSAAALFASSHVGVRMWTNELSTMSFSWGGSTSYFCATRMVAIADAAVTARTAAIAVA